MPEIQKQSEELQWPSVEGLKNSAATAGEKPAEVAKILQEDTVTQKILGRIRTLKDLPRTMLVGQTMWLVKWADSALEGTKNLLTGTGEFIGVWAAKLVHEWRDSFLQYANEKTQGVRDVVNIAGEAIALTAFEAMNSDYSVIMGAIRYWKEKGVELAKLSPEKQIELMASFQAQIAMGVVGSKGLGVASKTAALSNEISLGGKVLDKAVSIGAKVGVEASGLDSGALNKKSIPNMETVASEKIVRAEARSGVLHETVLHNASLQPTERLALTEQLVGKELNQAQKDTILRLHNDVSKGVYQNGHAELRTMVEELDKVGISRERTRELMENGILGSTQTLQDQMARFHNLDYLKGGEAPKIWSNRASARAEIVSNQMKTFQDSDLLQRLDPQLSRNPHNTDYIATLKRIADELPSNVDDAIVESSTERSALLKEAGSESLTREGFESVKERLQEQARSVGEKFADVHKLKQRMNEPGAHFPEETKRRVFLTQRQLINELDRIKSSIEWPKMTAAKQKVDRMDATKESPTHTPATKESPTHTPATNEPMQSGASTTENRLSYKERLKHDSRENYAFEQLSQEERVSVLLSDMKFKLSEHNSDRFFNITLPELDTATQGRFTPEVMARFGRDSNGGLLPEKGSLADKVVKAEARSGISHETVLHNANLPDAERLILAEQLVWKGLTQAQKDTILHLHNDISKGVYQNGHAELRTMVEVLDRVGISKEEGRVLMEHGVLGSTACLRTEARSLSTRNLELQVNTNAIPKLEGKKPHEVANIFREETDIIADPGNNLESILAHTDPNDAILYHGLSTKANTWTEARLDNIKNIVEYIENAHNSGLSEWEVVSAKVHLKNKVEKNAIIPLAQQVQALETSGTFTLSEQNYAKLRNLVNRLKQV